MEIFFVSMKWIKFRTSEMPDGMENAGAFSTEDNFKAAFT